MLISFVCQNCVPWALLEVLVCAENKFDMCLCFLLFSVPSRFLFLLQFVIEYFVINYNFTFSIPVFHKPITFGLC